MFIKRNIVLCLLLWTGIAAAGEQKKQLKDYLVDLPFPAPAVSEPKIPDRTLSIADYGAVADGYTLNTKAFSDAIAACAKAGGGTVLVPPGTWLTGPIRLVSNINLHVEKGALVQFSKKLEDNPFIDISNGRRNLWRAPLISAFGASNIAVTGDGIFDGGGEAWRYVVKEDMTQWQWNDLLESGGVISADGSHWWPSKEAMGAEEFLKNYGRSELTREEYEGTKEYFRPNLFSIAQCTNILLDGPTFQNSPRYHILPIQCENLIIRNVHVLAPAYGKNTDAIDPSACRNVLIYNCVIDVGDDGICLKPGRVGENQKSGPACENIVVADCVVYHAHGGFVIGSESYGGARNVLVRNCIFSGTDVGLRFKSVRGRGGVIEKIYIDGIQMRNIATDAILFDMYYAGGAPIAEAKRDLTIRSSEPVTDRTPQFKDFFVKNLICKGADRAVVINGLPELAIKNMVLDQVSVESKRGAFIADADGVQLNGCRIVPKSGPVITVISSRNVAVSGGTYPSVPEAFVKVFGEKSEHIRLTGIESNNVKKIQLDTGVSQNAVEIQ
jgi:polygalacturonase